LKQIHVLLLCIRKEISALMKQLKDRMFTRIFLGRVFKFLIIGGGVALFGGWLLNFLINEGVDKNLANVIQAFTSVTLNFIGNYILTWRDRREVSVMYSVRRFAGVRVITIPANIILFAMWTDIFGLTPTQAYILNLVLITVFNFGWNNFIVFPSQMSDEIEEEYEA